MGTHGRSGLNRSLLGSVTERVLRETAIPLLTVREPEGAAAERSGISKILCPVNDTPAARRARETAAGLARLFDAELTVLHVEEPHGPGAGPDFCQWLPEERRGACTLREARRQGDAAEETLKLAEDLGAGLLVIGAQHRMFRDTSVLGTTSVRVIRHSPAPVLSVFSPAGS